MSIKGNDLPDAALEAAAAWWAEVLKAPKNDMVEREHATRETDMAEMLMMIGTLRRPPVDTERFKTELFNRLRDAPFYEARHLSVDYHPNKILADAAIAAGVKDPDVFTFPVKTWMRIDHDKIDVQYGYSAQIETIWRIDG